MQSTPMSDLDQIATVCAETLRIAPSGLFTDFDGTISHVADTPGEARLAEGAGEALGRLARMVELVAVVTGRAAEDARALVDGPGVAVIGNHGMERLTGDERVIHPAAAAQISSISEALASVKSALEDDSELEGLLFENKGVSASIHYRLVANQEKARMRVLDLAKAEAEARGLKVTEGRLVVEIRPSVRIDKGTAVAQTIEDLGLRAAIFIGDDVTDVDAFDALRSLRSRGLATLSIGVISPETPPTVLEQSEAHVPGVDACVAMLHDVARRLES
jgi:trehalose 6-phosphate phosphatase